MPGMNRARLSTTNPTVVSAFHSLLLRECLVVFVILAVVLLVWNLIRAAAYRAARGEAEGSGNTPPLVFSAAPPEAPARRLLRITFGLLWVLDGLLQLQASMPLGLIPGSIEPTASGSPGFVRALVHAGATIWNDHPVTAAAAVVWIQLGVGLLMLLAPRGRWSRVSGVVCLSWGLVVWAFGESFGGIFAPGPSFLFGAPGAVIFYCAAGFLLALPESAFESSRLGRVLLAVIGAFLLLMALVQAWPSNGFWQGGRGGALPAMGYSMAATPQPGGLSATVHAFAAFEARHAVLVNGVTVGLLALIGLLLLSGRRLATSLALGTAAVFFLAVWVLVQDLGVVGGVGTDPNSMLPLLFLLAAGVLALRRPAPHAEVVQPQREPFAGLRAELRRRAGTQPSFLFRSVAAAGAVAVVLIGAVPMAGASLDPVAAPIVWQAIDGPASPLDTPAPSFRLVDQRGADVSLQALRGKVVAITFLDPVCTSDCPLIAAELHQAARSLPRGRVVFVAIVANPIYRSVADTDAFDREEGLTHWRNWLYLTGSRVALARTWRAFGVQVAVEPGGAMVAHNEVVFLVSRSGRLRYVLDADPGPGTQATQASFAGAVVTNVDRLLSRS